MSGVYKRWFLVLWMNGALNRARLDGPHASKALALEQQKLYESDILDEWDNIKITTMTVME